MIARASRPSNSHPELPSPWRRRQIIVPCVRTATATRSPVHGLVEMDEVQLLCRTLGHRFTLVSENAAQRGQTRGPECAARLLTGGVDDVGRYHPNGHPCCRVGNWCRVCGGRRARSKQAWSVRTGYLGARHRRALTARLTMGSNEIAPATGAMVARAPQLIEMARQTAAPRSLGSAACNLGRPCSSAAQHRGLQQTIAQRHLARCMRPYPP